MTGTFNLSATGEQWVPFTSRQRVITRSGRGCLPRWPASLVEPLAGPGLLLSGRLHGSGSNCPCGAGWCVDALACAAFLLHGDRAEPPVDGFVCAEGHGLVGAFAWLFNRTEGSNLWPFQLVVGILVFAALLLFSRNPAPQDRRFSS